MPLRFNGDGKGKVGRVQNKCFDKNILFEYESII